MSDAPFIPPKTAEKLNGTIPKGQRHQAKIDIALPLLGNGIPPIAVAQTLREKFPEAGLSEIDGVVRWCMERNPQPCTFSGSPRPMQRYVVEKPAKPTRTPVEQCEWWMGDATMTPEQMIESSPIAFKGTPAQEAALFFEQLYNPDDKLNIVCNFVLGENGKAKPSGGGKTDTRTAWTEYFSGKGVPKSKAGAWLRMNPCNDGSGAGGAITDADVTAWKFVLLESDAVVIETQLALFQRLKIPIAAILLSGSKSAHAWLRVDRPDAESYRAVTKRILELLHPFGIDPANKNASRLSRLPGAVRSIGAVGDGLQKLLYLDSQVPAITDEEIVALEARLKIPLAGDCPMRGLTFSALDRYEELFTNRGKLGVQVGLHEFDQDTGGFKAGQMTVIAAGTNQGKSTVALNLLNGALLNGHGVALFTLEMDSEEIMDLIVATNCQVNRNCFNTGYFQAGDFQKMSGMVNKLSRLPLWIYDEASMTVEDIRARVEALKAEGKISMVVIDYVQIVSPSNPNTPREQQVAEIARGIRILAKQTKLPFIVLSQLNDDGKLRESRVVAHEAHNVIILEPNDTQTMIKMKVVKGRRIMKKDYELNYQPEYARVHAARINLEDFPR
jgi:archaellum biogenesis ATPase FlaH